ncbi:MAG: biotin--[acetyl-CoA-carboxylase] ligase [Dehalococcoidia bacterium]|nr:biotin--[acetyl-CoA-carboxylase] ligase [Dehalococcoidia bacterium]
MPDSSTFDASRLSAALHTASLGRDFRYFPETSSTMDLARDAAAADAPHGSLILAEQQTAGRGRRGRGFFSPPGGSLYFTLILRPSREQYARLPLAVPLAVCRACAHEGVDARIKWPNDIWVNERKLCGMLIDGETGPGGLIAYAGIGINVNADPTADPTLREVATSLSLELGREVPREELLARICAELEAAIAAPEGELVASYRAVSLVLGRRVTVEESEGAYEARALDIAPDGALVVERDGGERLTVLAADVSVRPEG